MSDAHDELARELAPFERALAEEYAAEIEDDAPAPDLRAVLERARELEPARVPPELLEELAASAPVVSLRAHARRDDAALQRELDPFLASYRDELSVELDCQRIPPLAFVERARRRRTRRVALGLGLAASVALVFSLWRVLDSSQHETAARWQAEYVSTPSESSGRASPEPRASGRGVARPRAPEVDETTEAPSPAVEHDETQEAAPEQSSEVAADEPTEADTSGPQDDTKSARVSQKNELRRLDRRARAQWRAGDLRAAERSFRKLIELGGRHRLVDLAFGDLFSLSRQLYGEHAQPRLWREYLARFPRGRFADDARAGLCTRARGEAQDRCWSRYLRYFPDGAHSREARRRVDAAGSP